MYIAHFKELDRGNYLDQALRDHLRQSADLAGKSGRVLELESTCYLAGLLHDMGKYSEDFQDYINRARTAPQTVIRGSVDHSTAGGKLIHELCHDQRNIMGSLLAELVGNAIISHHSGLGLQNFVNIENNYDKPSDYLYRVEDKNIPNYEQAKLRFFEDTCSLSELKELIFKAEEEIKAYIPPRAGPVDFFFLAKFIYSCLLDADRTNTRQFEEDELDEKNGDKSDFLKIYQQQFENYNVTLKADSALNKLRKKMSNQCYDFAVRETGTYTLSIPTGGGKTLSSLRFALRHALLQGKKRIIYVVPFTTIIEQNAGVIKEILEDDENIVEHHSNIIRETVEDNPNKEGLERKQDLLRDTWDAPIIFTTTVQFLEVIYGSGTRTARRFHNLTNAILIFDEAQAVPIQTTYMFIDALNFLKKLGKTTNVLCTATQPTFNQLEGIKLDLSENPEMVGNIPEVEKAFKRVDVVDKTKPGGWELEELASFSEEIIDKQDSLLIILNTKFAVRKLFQLLGDKKSEKIKLYHLSTSMCAAHRKEILSEIKNHLKSTEKKVLCVTTQLIEAGVDISFQNVIRSVAGLDSIAQAAGRCNRNGELEQGTVYTLNLSDEVERLKSLPTIKSGKEVTTVLLKEGKYGNDLLKTEPVKEYFQGYYQKFLPEMKYPVKGKTFDLSALMAFSKNYWQNLEKRPMLMVKSSSKTIAKNFKVIDSPAKSLLVPYGKGEELIAQLNRELYLREKFKILKQAQQYLVNIFSHEQDELNRAGGIHKIIIDDEEILTLNPEFYTEYFGLDVTGTAEVKTSIF